MWELVSLLQGDYSVSLAFSSATVREMKTSIDQLKEAEWILLKQSIFEVSYTRTGSAEASNKSSLLLDLMFAYPDINVDNCVQKFMKQQYSTFLTDYSIEAAHDRIRLGHIAWCLLVIEDYQAAIEVCLKINFLEISEPSMEDLQAKHHHPPKLGHSTPPRSNQGSHGSIHEGTIGYSGHALVLAEAYFNNESYIEALDVCTSAIDSPRFCSLNTNVQAKWYCISGMSRVAIEEYSKAETVLLAALKLFDQKSSISHPSPTRLWEGLAYMAIARIEEKRHQFAQAIATATEGINAAGSQYQNPVLQGYLLIARCYIALFQHDKAIDLLKRMLANTRQPLMVARIHAQLGLVYLDQAQSARATAKYDAMMDDDLTCGPFSPPPAFLKVYAQALIPSVSWEERRRRADENLRDALKILTAILGNTHTETVAVDKALDIASNL